MFLTWLLCAKTGSRGRDLLDQVEAAAWGEINRARRKPTESLHAYEYYLRGLAKAHQGLPKRSATDLVRRQVAVVAANTTAVPVAKTTTTTIHSIHDVG